MSLRLPALLPLAVVVALVAACGGGGVERSLTEESASPSPSGAAPIFQRSPVPTSPGPTGAASPSATPAPAPTTSEVEVAVTPVAQAFQVTAKEAVNIRDRPSTSPESTILGGLFPGFKANVLGEARGQEVEAGQGDLWYQIELTQDGATIRGFVYAPFVVKAQ